MSASHSHAVTGAKLRLALVLTAVILVVEIAAGLLSHSLALLSDAGHVFTDLAALGLAWYATLQAQKPADADKTYGYHRTGILAALLNAATLIAIVAVITYEAVQRFQHPETVQPGLMFVAAAVGIAVNLFIGFSLRTEGGDNVNVRAAMLHVFGDVGAGVGVIVGGAVILFTGWSPADPLISLLIAALIARGAWDILRETVDILMESTPRGLDMTRLVRDMVRQPGVRDVHDLHVWSIAGGMRVLSAHVQVEDRPLSECERRIGSLNTMLRDRYAIGHTTLQLECEGCKLDHLYCSLTEDEHSHVPGHGHSHARSASRGA